MPEWKKIKIVTGQNARKKIINDNGVKGIDNVR